MSTQKRRRQYGTGSIYKRRDGRWAGAIDAGYTKTGNRRRITVYGRTKREAQDKLRAARKAILLDEIVEGVDTRTTVKKWSDTWFEQRPYKVRPKTVTGEISMINLWVLPIVGHRRLADLTPADLRKITSHMRSEGRSPSYQRYVHRYFLQMLNAARADGHQVSERLFLIDKPKEGLSDRDAIPFDDAIKILAEASKRPDSSRWLAAFLQGLRKGEALGLRWQYVDFENQTIDISWQLQTIKYKDPVRKTFQFPDGFEYEQLWNTYFLTRPKTAAGRRVIPMTPWMTEALLQWREICPPSEHGLVWPRENGLPQNPKTDTKIFNQLQKSAGVEKEPGRLYVLHEARHTTATLLLAANVPAEVIKSILGHSDVVVQQAYQHADLTMMRKALDEIGGLLGM